MNDLENIKIRIKNITESYKGDLTSGWFTGGGPIPSNTLFVGMSGKTFDKYLNYIGLSRKDVRVTNAFFSTY
jgi:hypothetical protein